MRGIRRSVDRVDEAKPSYRDRTIDKRLIWRRHSYIFTDAFVKTTWRVDGVVE